MSDVILLEGVCHAAHNFQALPFNLLKIFPWRIEDAAREHGANYVEGGLWRAFAVRDGRLIAGQQQYSGRKVAELVIQALGV